MKRILAFALIFTMLFTAMLGIMPAAEEIATLDITRANVEFGSTVYLLIEVDYAAAGLESGADVKVDVINKAGVPTTLTPDSSIKGIEEGCVGFKYTNLSAKEMGDVLTIKAYVDGKVAITDTTTYSILEYAVKAKATAPNSKLATVVEKMINFGAAAQEAFGYTGDYALKEDNASGFGYGMVLFSGVTENRKTLAAVDTSVNVPAANSSIFPNAAKLYNTSFDEVKTASVTVAEGITRYFYYGKDVMGNAGKFNMGSNNSYGSQDEYAYMHSTTYFDRLHSNLLETVHTLTGVTKTAIPTSRVNGGISGAIPESKTASAAPGYTSWYPWGIAAYVGNSKTASTADLEYSVGYMKFTTAGGTNNVSLYNYYTANVHAFEDAGNGRGTLTLSVSLALGEAKTNIHAGFTAVWSGSDNGAVYAATNVPYLEAFHVKDGVLYVGREGEDYTPVEYLNLNKVGADGWDKSDVITIHLVLDLTEMTVTAYNSANSATAVAPLHCAGSFFSDGGYERGTIFNMCMSGETYVSRVTISEGDLINR